MTHLTQHIEEMKKGFRDKSKCWDIASSVRPSIEDYLESSLRSLVEKIAVMAEEMKHGDDIPRAHGLSQVRWMDEGRNDVLTSFSSSLRGGLGK